MSVTLKGNLYDPGCEQRRGPGDQACVLVYFISFCDLIAEFQLRVRFLQAVDIVITYLFAVGKPAAKQKLLTLLFGIRFELFNFD